MNVRARYVLCTLLVLAACSRTVAPGELPELPAIDLDGVLPSIRSELEAATQAVEADPADANAAGQLAMRLAAYERLDAADVAYQRARLLAPGDPNWAYGHAHLLDWQGKTDVALEILSPFERRSVGNQRIVLKIGDLVRKSGDTKRARRLYERVIAAAPETFEAHYGLAKLDLADGQAAAAAQHLETAVSLQSGVGELHYALGQAYRDLGRPDAKNQFDLYEKYKHVELAEFDPWARRLSGLNQGDRMHMRRAANFFESGEYAKALLELEQAVGRNPQNISALTHMVWLYGRAGDVEKAESSYRKGLAIDSAFAPLHVNWATLMTRQQRYDEAEDALDNAITADPANAEAQAQLGFVYEEQSRADEAVVAYRKALEVDSGHRRANYLLGRQLALSGQPSQALRYLERATETKTPQTPLYLRTLAGVYMQLDDTDNAIKTLERALVQVPRQSSMASALREELRLAKAGTAE